MITLHDALTQYVAVRRALGTQLAEPAHTFRQFVAFVEREGASRITTALALRWAAAPPNVQRATWNRRLSMVRKVAAWLSAFDPATEVPPPRLISARHRRPRPHIYTEAETQRLMAVAATLSAPVTKVSLTATTKSSDQQPQCPFVVLPTLRDNRGANGGLPDD
jgi:integrase/recombinase XerD